MWLLEHEGEIFGGKKRWLRPGTIHLLGRTHNHKDGEQPRQTYHIDAKTVSRKHLLIEVGVADPNKGSDLTSRSALTFTDNSTFFTHINGEQLHQTTKTYTGDVIKIKLGKWEKLFKITWVPVVFSLNLSSKKRALDDPLASHRAKLGPLDIKVFADYDHRTTHVVADKRNTALGLQALIGGKPIVLEAFLDAVVRAATPGAGSDPNHPPTALLEDDFTKFWPPELDYLPPAGKEPVPREPALFLPNDARADVFKGYIFIFADEVQYVNLEPVVTLGNGKAFYFEFEPGKTTPEDYARFVKNKAGEDGFGELETTDCRGVVCVSARSIKGFKKWTEDLQRDVQLILNQRDVEQNEFLDAIVMNNAKVMRRRLPVEIQVPSTSQVDAARAAVEKRPTREEPKQSAPVQSTPNAETISQQISQKTTTRRKPTRVVTRKFKGFEDSDDDDPPMPPAADEDSVMDDADPSQASKAPGAPSQPAQSQRAATQTNKRPHEDQDENDDHLYPAAAAMKRRKLQQQSGTAETPSAESPPPKKSKAAEISRLRAAADNRNKEIDVAEALREQQERQAEEEAARLAAEEEDAILSDNEIRGLRDLVIIEEMELKPRTDKPTRATDDQNEDWNPAWNGRKNFKKFNKTRTGAAPLRGQRVMVQMEEMRKKEYGIGEDYWLDGGRTNNVARYSTAARLERDRQLQEEENDASFRRKRSVRQREEESIPTPQDPDETIDVDAELPEVAALSRRIASVQEQESTAGSGAGTPSQTLRAEDSTPEGTAADSSRKRTAGGAPAVQAPPAKRGRTGRVRDREEDDDGTSFKFKRGRRERG